MEKRSQIQKTTSVCVRKKKAYFFQDSRREKGCTRAAQKGKGLGKKEKNSVVKGGERLNREVGRS